MEKEVSPSDGNRNNRSSALSSSITSKIVNLSPLSETNSRSIENQNTIHHVASLYHSLPSEQNMQHSPSTASPPCSAPSAVSAHNSMATDNRHYQARLIMESHLYQELLNQYGVAVNYLHDLTREAKALREENELIRLANEDLTRHFGSLLSQPSVHQNRGVTSSTPSLTDDLRRFSASNKENHHEIPNDAALSDDILTCAIESDRLDGTGPDRVSLPKSISVRSSGYLKVNQPAGINVAGPSRAPNRSRMPSQPVDAARVFVKREEKTVEMDVYNQGMYKTELCNKWQETGACPYGDQCQFAHGLSELRPVLRHPRYKTNVCRMVLAGIICPYGHRCHFRHSVSDRERMMSPR